MQRNKENKVSWQYLAGFYDGEGTIGLKVIKEKRSSRITGETGGWYMSPYLEVANTNLKILKIIQKFLNDEGIISHIRSANYGPERQRGHALRIQSYGGIKKFLKNIYFYSLIKHKQINIMNEFFKIRNNLPVLKRGTRIDNLKRNFWSKNLFLRAMKLRDELKNTKFRRQVKHKYNYDYFRKLWN